MIFPWARREEIVDFIERVVADEPADEEEVIEALDELISPGRAAHPGTLCRLAVGE